MNKELIINQVILCDDTTRYNVQDDNSYKIITNTELINLHNNGYKLIGLHSIRIINSKIKAYISREVPRIDKKTKVHVKTKSSEIEKRTKLIEYINGRPKNVILFHGSIKGIQGNISTHMNRNDCDFGAGFYTGDMLEQAENRVANYSHSKTYAFEYVNNNSKIYRFTDNIIWALFVSYNRKKIDINKYNRLKEKLDTIDNNYDIIIGYIADDKISVAFNDFILGNITDLALSEALKMVKYGNQIVFKTDKALEGLKQIVCYTNTKEIRKSSIQWGINIKANMDERYNKIKIDFRRKGRFIDECMEEYNQ